MSYLLITGRLRYGLGSGQLTRTVNPLFAFAFLESFLETLEQYLGDVTEASIKDNFDVVYMVSRLSWPHCIGLLKS